MANRWGEIEIVTNFIWAPKLLWMVYAAMKLKDPPLLGRKAMTKLDTVLESRDIALPTKSKLWFFQWPCMDVRVGP